VVARCKCQPRLFVLTVAIAAGYGLAMEVSIQTP
jgi:hypothetical protein